MVTSLRWHFSTKLSVSLLCLAPAMIAHAEVNLNSQTPAQILAPLPPPGFNAGASGTLSSNSYNVNYPVAYLSGTTPTVVLPTNPQIIAGGVQINQSGNTMTVTESSQSAVVNWGSFNISKNGEVDFLQPNTQAIILNRVENGSIEIDGKLSANGQVFLVDANGIMFSIPPKSMSVAWWRRHLVLPIAIF